MSNVINTPLTRITKHIRDRLTEAHCCPTARRLILGGLAFPHEPKGLVYIAGPMRGLPQYNFPAFDAARDEWLAKGYAVLSPADIDRAAGSGPSREGFATGADEPDQSPYVLRDFHAIYLLAGIPGSKLVLIDGWRRSVGARAEHGLARWLKVEIVGTGETPAMDVVNLWYRQARWSQKAFGSDAMRGPIGTIKHLKAECDEVLADPDDRSEYADCLILIFDAARRAGLTLDQLVDAAHSKMAINEDRSWPTPTRDEPVMHTKAGPQ